MQYPNDSYLWRPNFVGALQLLGEAAARQPFGISDPILRGALTRRKRGSSVALAKT